MPSGRNDFSIFSIILTRSREWIFFPREEISLQHKLIPKYMANWNIVKAVASAERKLELVKVLEGEMKTLLPSSLLELYEMYRLALV